MADTVKRIEDGAFSRCYSLEFVKLSKNLEYIGVEAFAYCKALTSIFIPPSCREICQYAFEKCQKLIILHVPEHTTLGFGVIADTALFKAFKTSPFANEFGSHNEERVSEWIKMLMKMRNSLSIANVHPMNLPKTTFMKSLSVKVFHL